MDLGELIVLQQVIIAAAVVLGVVVVGLAAWVIHKKRGKKKPKPKAEDPVFT